MQKELGGREQGLSTRLPTQPVGPVRDNRGGGSDDIGDISWNVPTISYYDPTRYKTYLEQLGIKYPTVK